IEVELLPQDVAITPDGTRAYVTNLFGGISVIDTATNRVIPVPGGNAIEAGLTPMGIAITPDGKRAYVANLFGGVSVIDTGSNETIGVPGGEKLINVGN